MDKHDDLRIQRTRQFIRDAFLELLERKQFEKIRVTDITEAAMVNRSTFYRHYRDKYDLADCLQEEMIETFNTLASTMTGETLLTYLVDGAPLPHIMSLLTYVEQHPAFFRIMASRGFYDRIGTRVSETVKATFPHIRENALADRYGECVITAIFSSIIERWLEDGMAEGKEDIALLLTRIILTSRSQFIL